MSWCFRFEMWRLSRWIKDLRVVENGLRRAFGRTYARALTVSFLIHNPLVLLASSSFQLESRCSLKRFLGAGEGCHDEGRAGGANSRFHRPFAAANQGKLQGDAG